MKNQKEIQQLNDIYNGCTSLSNILPDLFDTSNVKSITEILSEELEQKLEQERKQKILENRNDKLNKVKKKIRRNKFKIWKKQNH